MFSKKLNRFATTLSIIFTLAIPMLLTGQWAGTIWALEGAFLVCLGLRQDQRFLSLLGILALLSSSVIFFRSTFYELAPSSPLNSFLLCRIFIISSIMFSSYLLYKADKQITIWERGAGHFLMGLGLLWWFATGFYQSAQYVDNNYQLNTNLLFITFSCALSYYLGQRLQWKPLNYLSFVLLPAMYFALLIHVIYIFIDLSNTFTSFADTTPIDHPFAFSGFIVWSIAFATQYTLLYHYDQWKGGRELKTYEHALTLWLVTIVLSWECVWLANQLLNNTDTWSTITLAWAPGLVIFGVSRLIKQIAWPFKQFQHGYLTLGLLPIIAFLLGWTVIANLTHLSSYSLPLDLTQVFVFATMIFWLKSAKVVAVPIFKEKKNEIIFYTALSLATIIWIIALIFRSFSS